MLGLRDIRGQGLEFFIWPMPCGLGIQLNLMDSLLPYGDLIKRILSNLAPYEINLERK